MVVVVASSVELWLWWYGWIGGYSLWVAMVVWLWWLAVAMSGEWWVCWLFLLGRKEMQIENQKEYFNEVVKI